MLGNQAFAVFSGRGVFANKLQYKLTDFVIILVYTIKSRSQVYIVAKGGELPTYMSIDNKT